MPGRKQMTKNNLGQPTISDVVTFFCDPCNAATCTECPINDILHAEKTAKQKTQLIDKTYPIKINARAALVIVNQYDKAGEIISIANILSPFTEE